MNKVTAYLSLGSNIGDRMKNLSAAKEGLKNHPNIKIIAESKIYEAEPWFEVRRPYSESKTTWYLNQVVKISTSLNPDELLKITCAIEKKLGRESKGDGAPRTMDIDILLYGDKIIDLPHLQIPHRQMNNRLFVLIPLLDIEPQLQDPVSGKKFRYIMSESKDEHKVIPFL